MQNHGLQNHYKLVFFNFKKWPTLNNKKSSKMFVIYKLPSSSSLLGHVGIFFLVGHVGIFFLAWSCWHLLPCLVMLASSSLLGHVGIFFFLAWSCWHLLPCLVMLASSSLLGHVGIFFFLAWSCWHLLLPCLVMLASSSSLLGHVGIFFLACLVKSQMVFIWFQ